MVNRLFLLEKRSATLHSSNLNIHRSWNGENGIPQCGCRGQCNMASAFLHSCRRFCAALSQNSSCLSEESSSVPAIPSSPSPAAAAAAMVAAGTVVAAVAAAAERQWHQQQTATCSGGQQSRVVTQQKGSSARGSCGRRKKQQRPSQVAEAMIPGNRDSSSRVSGCHSDCMHQRSSSCHLTLNESSICSPTRALGQACIICCSMLKRFIVVPQNSGLSTASPRISLNHSHCLMYFEDALAFSLELSTCRHSDGCSPSIAGLTWLCFGGYIAMVVLSYCYEIAAMLALQSLIVLSSRASCPLGSVGILTWLLLKLLN